MPHSINPMANLATRPPLTKWNATGGHFSGELHSNRIGAPPEIVTAEIDSPVIVDFGHMLDALVTFKPKYQVVAVPFGCGTPQVPPGLEDLPWQVATIIQMLFDGPLGPHPRQLTITSAIALNAMAGVWRQATYSADVQRGRIGVYIIRKPQPVTTDFGTFFAPALEIVDYIDRDQAVYGARITPPPPPIISGPSAPLPLPSPPSGGLAAATEPEAEPVKPADAPLDRYRPAGAGRKPY
jgi:hypothetical protein